MRCSVLGVVALMLGSVSTGWAGPVIVKPDEPRAAARIVVGAQPGKEIELAAKELRDHIEMMTGVALPVVKEAGEAAGLPIYLGAAAPHQQAMASKDPAAYRLRISAGAVELTGNSDEAVQYAVYDLLEQMGVRWLIPQEIGVDAPKLDRIELREQDTLSVPAYRGRILQAIGDAEWSRRQRLGGFNAGAHGLGPKFDRKTEPELFYTEDGKTTHQEKVSEPEVLRRVIAYWREKLKNNPDLEYISVGPHDGSGFGTDPWDADDFDPILGQGATTDRYVRFFNLILEDLQKDYPNVGLAFYAYTREMRPPVREKPNPRILPMLAAIGLDRFHSVHNPLSWEKQYLQTVVEGWQKLGVQMMFRGYLFNLADHGLPFSMIDIVRDEWPWYHDKGFIAMRVECIPNWAYHAPALYLAARLFWNPKQDADAIVAEWMDRMYGPAAPAMKQHFQIIEDAFVHGDYYTGNVYDVPKILTPQVRDRMAQTLKQAEGLAGTDGKYAQRLKLVRIGFDYGEANFAMMDAFFRGEFVEAKKHCDAITEQIIPVATTTKPPVIAPRSHVGYFKRFWSGNVNGAYERVTGDNSKVVSLPDEWLFFLDPHDVGETLFLYKPDIGTQPWQPIRTWSQTASNQGLRYYRWTGWYRCQATIPAAFQGRPLTLWFGGLDDTATVWINGVKLEMVGKKGAAPIGRAHEFDATPAVRFDQPNSIVVRVQDNSVNELGTFGINGPAMIWAGKKN